MDFKLNLIKNDVLPYNKRKLVFFSMILYVLMVGVLLVFLSHKAAVNFVKISDYKTAASYFQKAQLRNPGGKKDIQAYAKDLNARMLLFAVKLETVDKILSNNVDLTSIILRLLTPLSAGSYMDNINFNAQTGTLEYDIVTPVSGMNETANTKDLISAWKKDYYLSSCVKNMETISAVTQDKGETSIFVSKFSCRLNGREG